MKKISDISYEATLQTANGTEYNRVVANYDGTYMISQEMWAVFHESQNTCDVKFFPKGKDDELWKLGYLKVLKLVKVETYEERTAEYFFRTEHKCHDITDVVDDGRY